MMQFVVDPTALPGAITQAAATLTDAGFKVIAPIDAVDLGFGVATKDDLDNANVGLFLDVETTGLDHATAEVIELAIFRFLYNNAGIVLAKAGTWSWYNQPTKPIPADITALTGITNEMVASTKIDKDLVAQLAGTADLIVAHNAAFDRPFAEGIHEEFVAALWACSLTQVPWKSNGFYGRSLPGLCMQMGFHYDAHRALHDCHAGVTLLSRPFADTGMTVLGMLLTALRTPWHRVWAIGAPFTKKDVLNNRGYTWDVPRKVWYRDTEDINAELAWAFGNGLAYCDVAAITPTDAFSRRHGLVRRWFAKDGQ